MEFERRKKKKKSPPGPCSPFLSGAAQSVSLGFKPCAVPLQRFKMNKHKIKNETKARVAWLVQGGALGGILGCFFCHHLSNRSNLPYIWGSRSGNSTFDAHFYPCGTAAGCWYGKMVEEKKSVIAQWGNPGQNFCSSWNHLYLTIKIKWVWAQLGKNIWSKLKIRFSRGKSCT